MKGLSMSPEMVRALLRDVDPKTMTRRVIKDFPEYGQKTVAPQAERGDPPRHEKPYFDAYCNERKTESNPRGMSNNWCWWDEYDRQCFPMVKCPFQPGETVYIKEAWTIHKSHEGYMPDGSEIFRTSIYYLADGVRHEGIKVTAPRSMPESAARLFYKIKSIKGGRVGDISEEDAIREGGLYTDTGLDRWGQKNNGWSHVGNTTTYTCLLTARHSFANLWNSLHAKPKAVVVAGKVDHYVSYPFDGEPEVRTFWGKPWYVYPNPWVFIYELERVS